MVAGGSPAHAGIDPLMKSLPLIGRWLPRPRGDRPGDKMLFIFQEGAPPPTRG